MHPLATLSPPAPGALNPAHIPLYLYPFLNTVSRQRPFEYLRLTSLGVIGALVKVSSPFTAQDQTRPDHHLLLLLPDAY